MVAVLVILDGASEPLGAAPTSLERARTPVLDWLVREGTLSRVRTVAPGLPAGSETAIPALLGWRPPAAVDRAAIEAAAHGLEVPASHEVWRVDVPRGAVATMRRAAAALRADLPGHTVRALGGHRLLVCGPPPLPPATQRPGLRVWPRGVLPPAILGRDTVIVAALGAAVGVGRIMGATVIVPAGATGGPDTDLAAKAAAAANALSRATRVVVHVGAPDEAAHDRDAAGKVAVIERIDRELLAPLAAAVREAGATLTVCPDHGCDPATGEHDAAAVPHLRWPALGRRGAGRLTERDVRGLPATEAA
ncbi:MAG: hypothetical protein LC720_00805 [Actinobacteria bacterium]|nr:hypothetical protein [Actinomycetota bacterium]